MARDPSFQLRQEISSATGLRLTAPLVRLLTGSRARLEDIRCIRDLRSGTLGPALAEDITRLNRGERAHILSHGTMTLVDVCGDSGSLSIPYDGTHTIDISCGTSTSQVVIAYKTPDTLSRCVVRPDNPGELDVAPQIALALFALELELGNSFGVLREAVQTFVASAEAQIARLSSQVAIGKVMGIELGRSR